MYGYACINTELNSLPKSKRVTTNRTMRKATFEKNGLDYVSELVLQNITDLEKIFKWNEDHNIRFYRMSSEMFPWSSEYDLCDLKDWDRIADILDRCGKFASQYGHRISYHPGHFVKIASVRETTQDNSLREIEHHACVMDWIGLPQDHRSKINIHVGAVYENKEYTAQRVSDAVSRLSKSARSRLTFENDDKGSLWSVKDLYELVFPLTRVPIVFDYHHHSLLPDGLTEEQALRLACLTWEDKSIRPVTHYSQSRSIEKNEPKTKPQAHSDSYWTVPDTYGLDIDIMCECKLKEQGIYALWNMEGKNNG